MKMRILHVSHQYAPAIGGSEQYITDLSESLVRRGHTVDVFTSQARDYHTWHNELSAHEVINGVSVHRFPSLSRGPRTWRILATGLRNYRQFRSPLFEPHIFFGNGPLSWPLFRAIWQQARNYDLLHINQLHYAHAWTAYMAARLRGLPTVITPHLHVEQPETYDVGYMWRILRGSEAIFAVTAAESAFLQQHLPQQLVVQGGNGLNLAAFPPRERGASRTQLGLPADAFVLLFLGRKTEYKGLRSVVETFVRLRPSYPNLYLLAAGPETEYSQALWREVGPVEGLSVHGAVDDETRLAALAACDALALPSTGEAFGIVYLEAWLYGKPVIGANIQSVASLIHDGVDGFVVDPMQPSQLLRAVLTLMEDPTRARQMGKQGRAKVLQRYTTERITDVIEGTYSRVLRRVRTRLQPSAAASATVGQGA